MPPADWFSRLKSLMGNDDVTTGTDGPEVPAEDPKMDETGTTGNVAADKDQKPRSVSPLGELEAGHRRPVNPPLSRNVVQQQVKSISIWQNVDNGQDVMIGIAGAKRKLQQTEAGDDSDIGDSAQHVSDAQNLSSRVHTQDLFSGRRDAPKRRRLIISEIVRAQNDGPRFEQLSNQQSDIYEASGGAQMSTEITIGQFSANTGSKSSAFDYHSSKATDTPEDLTDVENQEPQSTSVMPDGEDLLSLHVRLHARYVRNQTSAESSDPTRAVASDDGVRQKEEEESKRRDALKEAEEAAGVARSRKLRARKFDDGYSATFEESLAARASVNEQDYDIVSQEDESDVSSFFTTEESSSFSTVSDIGTDSAQSRVQVPQYLKSSLGNTRGREGQHQGSGEDEQKAEVEALLDVAEASQMDDEISSKSHSLNAVPYSQQYHSRPRLANPFSRQAAEKFRTQSRHLSAKIPKGSLDRGRVEGEARLRAVRKRFSTPKAVALDYQERKRPPTRLAGPSPEFSLPSPPHEYSPSDSPPSSPADSQIVPPAQPRWKRNPSSSQVQAIQEDQQSRADWQTRDTSVEADAGYPPGQSRSIDLDDFQEVIKEHERLKNQLRDLNCIKKTFWEIARWMSIEDLSETEERERSEAMRFVALVLDKGLPSNGRRKRIQDIFDNMRRRLEKLDPDQVPHEDFEVEELYYGLLGKDHVAQLEEALHTIDQFISDLRIRRTYLRSRDEKSRRPSRAKSGSLRKSRPSQKRVRWADMQDSDGQLRRDLPDGVEIDLDSPPVPRSKPKRLNKTEREIQAIKAKLEDIHRAASTSDRSDRQNDDSESEGSDEKAPRDYNSGGSAFTARRSDPWCTSLERVDTEQDLDEINRLENERQRDEARELIAFTRKPSSQSCAISSQGFDPTLIVENRKRHAERVGSQVDTTARDPEEEQLFDDWDDSETATASDEDDSESSDSESDGLVQVYRYKVSGRFVGIDVYLDEDEILFGLFQSADNANKKVSEVISGVARDCAAKYGKDFELHTRSTGGLYDQLFTLDGSGNQGVVARVWVERELKEVDLDKVAANKAQKWRLVKSTQCFRAVCEKTTTTNSTPAAIGPPSVLKNDEVEDLFSPDIPAAPIVSIFNHPTETLIFTDLAYANRKAKENFMTWYSQFFPEDQRKRCYKTDRGTLRYDYSGFLAQVNNEKERQLEMLGGKGCFDVEDEVEVKESTEGGGEGYGKNEEAVARTGEKVVREKVRIFVEVVDMLGPAN